MCTKVSIKVGEKDVELGAGFFPTFEPDQLTQDFLFWIQTDEETVTLKLERRQLKALCEAMEFINGTYTR